MTFASATAVQTIDAHTYTADFRSEWCIGSVPHGGYVTACFQTVVRKHFDTTLRAQNQPHTLALHLDFLRRTQVGLATFKVKDVKIGRQTSVVHVTLFQEDREEVVGYITNSNLDKETGVSFDTKWQLLPSPPPVQSFTALERNEDPSWGERKRWPFSDFRRASRRIRAFFPRAGQPMQACLDMWFCFSDPGSRFTPESLGYVVDTFPQIIEGFNLGFDPYSLDFEEKYTVEQQNSKMKGAGGMWYPTLLLNLDVKKALPDEGVRWLAVRLQAKKIRNGRYDLEVLALDEHGELVAVSNHVCFAVSAARNTSARRKAGTGQTRL